VVSSFRLGDAKQSGARQSVLTAALASGGIRTEPSDDPRATRPVAVICAAHDVTEEDRRAYADSLRDAGATLVIERAQDELDVLELHDAVFVALGVTA
jgi:hypothetical protein